MNPTSFLDKWDSVKDGPLNRDNFEKKIRNKYNLRPIKL